MAFIGKENNSKTYNETQANQVGVSDLSDNAQATTLIGEGNTLTLTDHGAVMSAFDFAQNAAGESADLVRDISSAANSNTSNAIQAVTESARAESENVLINLGKYGFYISIALGAAYVLKSWVSNGGKKKNADK